MRSGNGTLLLVWQSGNTEPFLRNGHRMVLYSGFFWLGHYECIKTLLRVLSRILDLKKKLCHNFYSRQFGSADPDTKWWCRQQQRTWWWQKFGWNHSVAKVLPLRFFNRIPTWSNKSSWKRETFLHRYISVILLYLQVMASLAATLKWNRCIFRR